MARSESGCSDTNVVVETSPHPSDASVSEAGEFVKLPATAAFRVDRAARVVVTCSRRWCSLRSFDHGERTAIEHCPDCIPELLNLNGKLLCSRPWGT